ncbi:MAG: amidohydrolase family protein [Chloroflexota bacterium]|nr:amidohydrolase family protein [Chloroflexota bacterium]
MSPPLRIDDLTLFDGWYVKERQSVVTNGSHFVWVGPTNQCSESLSGGIARIDGRGLFACPGFIDSHLHLAGLAAALSGHDLSNVFDSDPNTFLESLKSVCEEDLQSDWLRFYSLDYFDALDAGLLNRNLVDSAIPDRPVVIRFNSGHGVLLNTMAMQRLGINESTPEPPGITFGRTIPHGVLSGVILEGDEILSKNMPPSPNSQLVSGFRLVNQLLIKYGITCVVDATRTNDMERLCMTRNLVAGGQVSPDIVFMPGYEHIGEFRLNHLTYNSEYAGIRIGCAKIQISLSGGSVYPNSSDLSEIINDSHKQGFPVSIHAVEQECISIAVDALCRSRMNGDRIEHASELDDRTLSKLAHSGVSVSTQPAFLHSYGDRYIQRSDSSKLQMLYRISSLNKLGIKVGFSSDAPVTYPNALGSIYSAVTRRTLKGNVVNGDETISPMDSMRLLTNVNAGICGVGEQKGQIKAGYDADLVLLDRNPITSDIEDILKTSVQLTMRRGEILYNNL